MDTHQDQEVPTKYDEKMVTLLALEYFKLKQSASLARGMKSALRGAIQKAKEKLFSE